LSHERTSSVNVLSAAKLQVTITAQWHSRAKLDILA